jgi:HPt (histidine-containing phosphotransfer) domain-containing protein
VLDARVLLAACGGDPDILADICQGLRDHLPAALARARHSLRQGDAPALREAAHKLHGMLSMFSTSVATVTASLEDHAALGHLDACVALDRELDDLVRELLRGLDGVTIEAIRSMVDDAPPA